MRRRGLGAGSSQHMGEGQVEERKYDSFLPRPALNRQTVMPQAKQLSSKSSKVGRGSIMPSSHMGLGMERK